MATGSLPIGHRNKKKTKELIHVWEILGILAKFRAFSLLPFSLSTLYYLCSLVAGSLLSQVSNPSYWRQTAKGPWTGEKNWPSKDLSGHWDKRSLLYSYSYPSSYLRTSLQMESQSRLPALGIKKFYLGFSYDKNLFTMALDLPLSIPIWDSEKPNDLAKVT